MASFGESLRRERELRDISLREIADATKINLRYLEALEQNRFDILPGGVFNKGFIRAYARFIGADGESLVDAYLVEIAPRESGVMPTVFGEPGLLRLPEAPKRRAEPTASLPGTGTTAAPLAVPAAVKAPTVPAPVKPPPVPAAAKAPAVPAAPPGPALPAAKPAAEPRPASAPRPAAPLRIMTAPVHHEPLTERAAAIAAITHPPPAGQPAVRRRPGLTPGIAFAAGGLVLAGGLAILVTRGLGARDGATPRDAATPPTTRSDASALEESGPIAAALGPTTDATTAAAPSMPAPEGAGAAGLAAMTGAYAGPTTATPSARAGDPPGPASGSASTMRPREANAEPPAAPRGAAAPRAAIAAEETPRAPALPGMEFRIEATAQVWVQVSCDGEDKVNRMLQSGEGATLRCLSVVRVSVTDGGAVRLMMDGARCNTPGESGFEMKGFVIRAENAAAICPPGPGGSNGRR